MQEHFNFLARVSSPVFDGRLRKFYGCIIKDHDLVAAGVRDAIVLLRSVDGSALFLLLEEFCKRLLNLFWVRWQDSFLVVDSHLHFQRRSRNVLGGLDV